MLTLQEFAFAIAPHTSEEMENEVSQEQWTMVCNYTPVHHEKDYAELFESALWTSVGMSGPRIDFLVSGPPQIS